MNQQHAVSTRRGSYRTLTTSAMFTAMITLTTAFLFHIPTGTNGGYLHFGDTLIYLAACFLPMPYACIAASVGGGLADFLSGAPIWILPTMIIKPLTAIWFTNKGTLLCRRNVISLVLAGLVSNVGYYLAEVYFTGSWLAPLAFQWSGVVQSGGSAAFFLLLAVTLDKLNIKKQLRL